MLGIFFFQHNKLRGNVFPHQHNKPKASNEKLKRSNIFSHRETKITLIQAQRFLSPRHITIPQNLYLKKSIGKTLSFEDVYFSVGVLHKVWHLKEQIINRKRVSTVREDKLSFCIGRVHFEYAINANT